MSQMSKNASIRDFFKPKQPAAKTLATPPSQPSSDIKIPPPAPPAPPAIRSGNTLKPQIFSPPITLGQAASTAETAPEPSERGYTSSLSPPPSTLTSPESPKKEDVAPRPPSLLTTGSSERVIRNSDDEDEDSDSSLEDITTLFPTHRSSDTQPRQGTSGFTPSTPTASRYKNVNNFYSSPLTFQPKYKFDLKTLVSHAENDEATEASSNRVKAMMASKDVVEDAPMTNSGAANPEKFVHGDLLESVVAEREDGGAHKVKRALMRTEATVSEKRWYFFDTETKKSKIERKPFPTRSVSEEWRSELVNPETRYHSFISGFTADLIELGRALPDELFLWMLDEVCIEANEPLRTSYLNTMKLCSEQVSRLIVPETLQSLFRGLGGTQDATIITEKIRPIQAPPEHYSNRDWGKGHLLSVIRFLGRSTKSLQQASRTYIVTMLLRMSVDRVVCENVDLLDLVQQTISRLCHYTPDNAWEASCQEIIKPLFTSISQPALRVQILDSIPSSHPRTHDLRRRLAMCFYFDSLFYSTSHSHSLIDIDRFIRRLDDPAFDTTPKTDYRELTALVSLLDIAVDDGRSVQLDLSDKAVERKFNQDIDAFVAVIKEIMGGIGNPGAAFISRIEAKETLELVSQRISDSLRTKPKPKQTWLDDIKGLKEEEDFDVEKVGMQRFVSRMKGIGNGGSK